MYLPGAYRLEITNTNAGLNYFWNSPDRSCISPSESLSQGDGRPQARGGKWGAEAVADPPRSSVLGSGGAWPACPVLPARSAKEDSAAACPGWEAGELCGALLVHRRWVTGGRFAAGGRPQQRTETLWVWQPLQLLGPLHRARSRRSLQTTRGCGKCPTGCGPALTCVLSWPWQTQLTSGFCSLWLS